MKVIEQEIAALKNTINEMWALVHQQIYNAGEAMLTGDKELAYKVLSRERRVNAFELKIDSDCEDIIALYAPVAIDLRFVLAMYKINTNLERLGDFAESIARALAISPSILLMDEPTSALDPISTSKIEDLIHELKKEYTIVIVTHNMQQAARVSDKTGYFYLGELVEYGETRKIFTNPEKESTQNYITGRFG